MGFMQSQSLDISEITTETKYNQNQNQKVMNSDITHLMSYLTLW